MASNESARYFEDIEIGETMEHGEYRVTAEEVVEFAEQYDPQPFHVDEEAARNSVFGELVASGWHTGAMTMKLLVEGRDDDTASAGGVASTTFGGTNRCDPVTCSPSERRRSRKTRPATCPASDTSTTG